LFASLFAAHVAALPVPQRWSFALQVNPHTPPGEHVGVPPATAGHWTLHPPQWFGSICSLTQELPHKLRPAAQPDVHTKGWLTLPVAEQSGRPPEQVVAHPPQ
jgi:hypothetical protein